MLKIKRKMMTVVIAVLVVVAAVGAGYFCGLYKDRAERDALMEQRIQEIQNTNAKEKQSLLDRIDQLIAGEVAVFDAAPIQEQILEMGELATVTYAYTNVGTVDSEKHFNFVDLKIPFSGKEIVISMDGVLKVGIDVTKVEILTDEPGKTITVIIPEATILSNELDEDSLVVHVEKEGWLNGITLADGSAVRSEIKRKAEEKAVAHGLLKQARENAGEVVCNLIEAVPHIKDTYTIIVK